MSILSNLKKGLLLSSISLWGVNCKTVIEEPATAAQKRPPNIILIMADDLGYETLGCNGGQSYQTPQLDKLAAEGVRFTHCYSLPLCTPSRVQLMTGKYGFRNYIKFGLLDASERTIGNLLRDNGYSTCIVGKWQLGGDKTAPDHFGFDEYLLWQLTQKNSGARYRNPLLVENGFVKQYTNNEYGPDRFYEYASDFITRHKDSPFFLYYPMVLTHRPFQPVPGGRDYASVGIKESDTAYFRDMVGYTDKIVGKIMAKIDELGLAEETIVMFTSDNGTYRDIYSTFKSSVVKGNKGYPTSTGTHVPLIVHWKGKIAHQTINQLVDFTDFYVTLAEVAGVRISNNKPIDGVSFLGQLLQQKNAPVRKFVFGDYNGLDMGFVAARYAHDKSLKVFETGEVYRIENDPEEKKPLLEKDLTREEIKKVEELKAIIASMHN
jgi:arylsulfatase A